MVYKLMILPFLVAVTFAYAGQTKDLVIGEPVVDELGRDIYYLSWFADSEERISNGLAALERIRQLKSEKLKPGLQGKINILEIKALCLLGKKQQAQKAILDYLSDTGDDRLSVFVVDCLDLSGYLYRSDFLELARKCEKRAANALHGKQLDKAAIYEIFKSAFLFGRTEFVLSSFQTVSMEGGDIDKDFDLMLLRARAASMEFRRVDIKVKGFASSSQGEILRTWARKSTAFYEKAAKLAPSRYQQLQIFSEWWDLRAHRRYDCDSIQLREILSKKNEIDSGKSKDLIESRQARLVEVINHLPVLKGADQEQIKSISKMYSRMIENFEIESIPEAHFSKTLDDIDILWSVYVPVYVSGGGMSSFQFKLSLTWYLWSSLIRSNPDKYEEEIIDKQIAACSRFIENAAKELKLNSVSLQMSDKFKSKFQELRHNRFVPYYKNALLPFELKKNKDIYIEKWRTRIDAYRKMPSLKKDELTRQLEVLVGDMINILSINEKPVFRSHLPGSVISSCGHTVTKNYIMVFSVSGIQTKGPYLQYGSKKIITYKDAMVNMMGESFFHDGPKVAKGISGSGYHFDSLGDYIEIDDFKTTDIQKDNFAFSMYFKTDNNKMRQVIIGSTEKNEPWFVEINPVDYKNPVLCFCVGDLVFSSKTLIKDNEWYHLACIIKGREVFFYINGELDNMWQSPKQISINLQSLKLGGGDNLRRYFCGVIDEVSIFNKNLKESDIATFYKKKGKLDGDDPGLIVYWNFDSDRGSTVKDSSTYGHDGFLKQMQEHSIKTKQ